MQNISFLGENMKKIEAIIKPF